MRLFNDQAGLKILDSGHARRGTAGFLGALQGPAARLIGAGMISSYDIKDTIHGTRR